MITQAEMDELRIGAKVFVYREMKSALIDYMGARMEAVSENLQGAGRRQLAQSVEPVPGQEGPLPGAPGGEPGPAQPPPGPNDLGPGEGEEIAGAY